MQLPCRRLRRPRRVLRHRPAASCSAPMASRLRLSVKPDNPMPGCLPAPRPPRSLRQRRLRSRTPKSSRRAPRTLRWSREAAALPRPDASTPSRRTARVPSIRPCRPLCGPHGASVPDAGASPRRLQNAPASRKRHPDVGGHAWPPRPRAGFPPAVRSPGLPKSPPTTPHRGGFMDGRTIASAPRRHQKRVLSSPRRCWPQRRLDALSLPTCPPRASVPDESPRRPATDRGGSDSAKAPSSRQMGQTPYSNDGSSGSNARKTYGNSS